MEVSQLAGPQQHFLPKLFPNSPTTYTEPPGPRTQRSQPWDLGRTRVALSMSVILHIW